MVVDHTLSTAVVIISISTLEHFLGNKYSIKILCTYSGPKSMFCPLKKNNNDYLLSSYHVLDTTMSLIHTIPFNMQRANSSNSPEGIYSLVEDMRHIFACEKLNLKRGK